MCSVMIEWCSHPLHVFRYQYDRGRLQELISELEGVSFDISGSQRKTKRGKVEVLLILECVSRVRCFVCVLACVCHMTVRKPLRAFVFFLIASYSDDCLFPGSEIRFCLIMTSIEVGNLHILIHPTTTCCCP